MTTIQPAAVVVGAAILRGVAPAVEVLAAQRARPPELSGWWEFPGGKVEPGESEQAALVRECAEELGVVVSVGHRIGADVEVVGGGAVLRVWTAAIESGEPTPGEHRALRWLGVHELDDVAWLPPDVPVVAALRRALLDGG
jgi:8-oxo-dGTP diphosphatase